MVRENKPASARAAGRGTINIITRKKANKTKPAAAAAAETTARAANTDSTTSSAWNPFLQTPLTKLTATHIFFHGGLLSNWYTSSPKFPGHRCFDLMIPKLDELDISHPARSALSTVLMSQHMFNCGEQWMMAMKGWLFERDPEVGLEIEVDLECEESTETVMGRLEYERLKDGLMAVQMEEAWKVEQRGCGVVLTKEGRMYKSTLCEVLRAKHPQDQKRFGRLTEGFDVNVWEVASVPSTVAACVARAEVDNRLRDGYLLSGTRKYVEGAKSDKVWGVGIKWSDPRIENEAQWRGENRLGKCHDEAARIIRALSDDNGLDIGT